VNGHIGWARNYKRNALVTLYGPDGSAERYWHLIGVWPGSFDQGDIDMEGGDYLKITMTLNIDKAFQHKDAKGGNAQHQKIAGPQARDDA